MAERITQQRHKLGLERKQAAHKIGIDYQYLYKLEEGVNKPPTWDTLIKLANGLQCSVDYLLGLTEDPTPAASREGLTDEQRTAAELIASVPADKQAASPMCKMPQRPRLIKPALSVTDVRRILKRSNVREQAIILFLLDTGLRASELCKLNRADVDLNTAQVKVREGKGGKDRTVYMGARVVKALLRYWADVGEPLPGEAVFKSERGQRLTRNALWKICGRLADAVEVPELSPHALRRTFAIYSLRAGMDLYTLARLMGHEGIDVLKQYLDLLPDDLAAAHAKYGPADNL